ncbi:MAG: rhomboid family intramembrane serine protease, partial [Candidatus Xenobia bacterium]
ILGTSVYPVLGWFIPELVQWMGLVPTDVLHHYQVWRLLTYMLLHAGVSHLVFNMLALWFFAGEVEEAWGQSKFLTFYLLCGVAGAITSSLIEPNAWVVGASGAIMGVMVAYAVLWPDRVVLFMAIFPIAAKWLVAIMVGIDLVITLQSTGNPTATLCHLGGAAFGFIYIKLFPKFSFDFRRVGRPKPRLVRRNLELDPVPARGASPRPQMRVVPDEPPRDTALQSRVDAVLDKIAREGMAALTPDEKALLDQASRRLRNSSE